MTKYIAFAFGALVICGMIATGWTKAAGSSALVIPVIICAVSGILIYKRHSGQRW